MDDEFNPDNFDWDDAGLGDGDVAIHDVIREHALSSLAGPDPVRYVRASRLDTDRPKPIFKCRYALGPNSVHLEEDFPGWIFDYSDARRSHDHPLSHISRELQEYEMVDSFRDEQYIDMHGNPGRNAKYNRAAITMGGFFTPKDHIRYYNKRGVLPVDIDGICSGKYGNSKNVSSTHALYYESLDNIARICASGRMYHALIHRHSQAHGFLNHGEQEYWVDQNGWVKQVNVGTGESYAHPTCEPFFHQTSAKTGSGGITWDIRKAGPDSFVLRFVAAPNAMCEKFRTLQQLASSDAKVVVVDDVTVRSFLGYRWYTKGTPKGEVALKDSDLLEKLRRYIAGRKRTPEQKENLMNFCRRNCNKNDVISVHAGYFHAVPAEQMVDYVNTAFYMDIKHELESAIYFETKYAGHRDALNEYYEKGTLPAHLYSFNEVKQTVAATVSSVVDALFPARPYNSPPSHVVDWASPSVKGRSTIIKTTDHGAIVDGRWHKVWERGKKV